MRCAPIHTLYTSCSAGTKFANVPSKFFSVNVQKDQRAIASRWDFTTGKASYGREFAEKALRHAVAVSPGLDKVFTQFLPAFYVACANENKIVDICGFMIDYFNVSI